MTSIKHTLPEDKTDEVKALIARYILLRIEQKRIEKNVYVLAVLFCLY
jgi:hypothetical protein